MAADTARLKEKHQKELDSVEQSYRETIDLLGGEKEKILGSIHESIERERQKNDQMHISDLEQKERIFEQNLQGLKEQMRKEMQALEDQLTQQQEFRRLIEQVQKQTSQITEIVQSNLRQREDEIKRREVEVARMEREMQEMETIQIELEEIKLAEEERKLQQRKDSLLKTKQQQNEEIN